MMSVFEQDVVYLVSHEFIADLAAARRKTPGIRYFSHASPHRH
jgi:hypothetical protein